MTITDTAPGGDLDTRLARLADEATAIVRSVDAEGRPFTQAEDDRIKALFNEATATLTRQKAGGGLVPPDDVNTLAPPPDRAGFARSSRLAFTPRGEKARRHPWAKAVVEAQRGGPRYKQLEITGGVNVPNVLTPGIFPEGAAGPLVASLCSRTELTNGRFT